MYVIDVIYGILNASYKNYDGLFNDNDLKDYIKASMDFIEKHKEFMKLVKSTEPSLIKRLSELSVELKQIQEKLEYYCKIEHLSHESTIQAISSLILKNKNSIFGSQKNLQDINNNIDYDLFMPINDYVNIVDDFDTNITTIVNDNKYYFGDSASNNYSILKAILCIFRVYSNVYDRYGTKGLNRIKQVNDNIYKMKEMYRSSLFSKKTDLFDIIYNYKLLFKAYNLSEIDSFCDALYDIADETGMFKDFNEYEIAELLYKCNVFNRKDLIMSKKKRHSFKDLTAIGNAIKNGVSNGRASSQTIDEFIKGSLNLTINEKNNGGTYGTI